jgi:hypothetical protein
MTRVVALMDVSFSDERQELRGRSSGSWLTTMAGNGAP